MEPLSAASSVFAVVSVAIELVKGIHKLVVFCKAVQDAPAGLKYLVEDLESLSELLGQLCIVHERAENEFVEVAVQKCRACVKKLEKKIQGPSQNLESESRARRFRGRFKVVLQQSEIQDLRSEIERAKSQLQIAQLNSLIRVSQSHYQSQKQFLLEFKEDIRYLTQQGFDSLLLEQSRLSDTMQLLTNEDSQVQNNLLLQINLETTSFAAPNTRFISQSTVRQETTAIRDKDLLNHFLTVQKRTRIVRTTKIFPSGTKSTEEEQFDYLFHPASFLRHFGLTYGFWMQTRSSSWQFSLQPFNVVKESSPIFEFCRNGNLDAVQTLIGLGEASVRDRDPLGRTPLWIAANSLQAEIAELLLREGADPHVSDWGRKCPPIAAIQESASNDITLKQAMISVFQTHSPDGHDSLEVWNSVGKLLLSYRPQRIMAMEPSERNNGASLLLRQLCNFLPQEDEKWIQILFGVMQLFYDAEIIRWTVSRIQGMFPTNDDDSAIHRALAMKLFVSDPVAAGMIVRKTERSAMHRSWAREYSGIPPGTPMGLAMYQPDLFIAWVGVLRDVGIDMEEYIREELNDESNGRKLREDGWEIDSLMEVVESVVGEEEVSQITFLRCERCGRAEGSSWLKVDLAWRRSLTKIRSRYNPGSMKAFGIDSKLQTKLVVDAFPEVGQLAYNIVCSDECKDGVCVAWVSEGTSEKEPCLPAYPGHEKGQETVASLEDDSRSIVEKCPTERMPGAFGD